MVSAGFSPSGAAAGGPRAALRERCRDKLTPPFEISAMAWAVTASVT
jgi:hypothetical protein